jgi:hypothetical protein
MLHRSQLAHHFANRFQTIRDHAERATLPARFGHADGNRLGMDIETDEPVT